ncbi:MAG: amidohydrolase [Lawsonibacter sp.]|nr:amidohydrolase [Lawsonibacter sp.]
MGSMFREAQALQEQIAAWRRALHQIPETGLVLPQTAEFVKARLAEMGLSYQEYEGHSGLTVAIGKGKKTVALRADMDALAIQEETGLPYAAQNGNMHACGHDAHTAMLLTAAQLLRAHEQELNGRVKLIFQPAEEGPGGAEPMVRNGVVTDVDGIFALHIGDIAGHFEPGGIAVSYGETTAADDQVLIEIKGQGGHGSAPHVCVDPVTVAAAIINNLQHIVSREVDAHDAVVITIASVEAGRGTYNVIPETATLRGTIRNAAPRTRDFVLGRIEKVALATAQMMRASCTVRFLDGYPALVNDRNMVESFLKTAGKLLTPEEIHILPHGMLGGEDAAFFFREVPGCFFILPSSAPCPVDGTVYGAHHPKFCLDESVFWRGAGLLAQSAVDWLEQA